MDSSSLTRWQKFYQDDSKLGDIPPSKCALMAEEIFSEKNCQAVLDLGCGTGRDSLKLAENGKRVFGVDAAHSGLLLAHKQSTIVNSTTFWAVSDSRCLPFAESMFDGVYCFGLLHEFVGELSEKNVDRTILEIQRVLKPTGVIIIATAAGDPKLGLPHVQNFTEAMFDAVTAGFYCIEKKIYDDLGCTGRTDYKVWFGHFTNI